MSWGGLVGLGPAIPLDHCCDIQKGLWDGGLPVIWNEEDLDASPASSRVWF